MLLGNKDMSTPSETNETSNMPTESSSPPVSPPAKRRGRPRLYKTKADIRRANAERERARRARIKEEKIKAGIPIRPVGRPRLYHSEEERREAKRLYILKWCEKKVQRISS